jgi:uncharacterized protein
MTVLAIGAIVMFFAGLVQGCTGFGLALVAAPCLLLLLPTTQVVPTVVLVSTINCFVLAMEARRHIRARIVAPLLAGALIGMPLGVHTLKVVNDTHLKVGVAIFVFAFACILLAGWRMPLGEGKRVMVPVGMLSGFIGGSTSMGGPPIVLFLANKDTPKDLFRANLVCYFFLLNTTAICTFFLKGLLTWSVAGRAGAFMLTMLTGTCVGVALSRRLPEERFRKLAMVLAACAGILLFVTNVGKLF